MDKCDNRHVSESIDNCWKNIGVWGDKTCPELVQCLHCHHCDTFARAGLLLFDRQPPDDYIRFWTRQLARPKEKQLSGCVSVLVFRIRREWFALKTVLVAEVLDIRSVHSVPHHGNGILRGLINVHGELQLCVAMEKFLAIEQDDAQRQEHDNKVIPRLLLISDGGESLAFEVSEVACVYACHPDEVEGMPATLPRERIPLLKGLLHWQQHHVAILNDEILMEKLSEKIR